MKPTILKPSEMMERLALYKGKAKKHFGQNFIIDNNIVEKIARLGQAKNQKVLEIGPGLGALTQFLLREAESVVAVEIDPVCVDILNERFGELKHFTLIQGDILELNPATINVHQPTHLIANLPYYITTPILFHVMETMPSVTHMSVMVQKEVADRFSARPNTKAYGALSVLLQTHYAIETVMQVPSSVFYPKPRVASSVVHFTRREHRALDPAFSALVKQGFAQRRKTLINNLKAYPHCADVLKQLKLDLAIRGEALSPEQWLLLYQALMK